MEKTITKDHVEKTFKEAVNIDFVQFLLANFKMYTDQNKNISLLEILCSLATFTSHALIPLIKHPTIGNDLDEHFSIMVKSAIRGMATALQNGELDELPEDNKKCDHSESVEVDGNDLYDQKEGFIYCIKCDKYFEYSVYKEIGNDNDSQ